MAEEGEAGNGAAGTQEPAAAPPIMVAERALEGANAPSVPPPEAAASTDPPAAAAAPGRADLFSVAVSAVGHLVIGLLVIGSLASVQQPPEAIPVKLIPADQAPPEPKPPEPPPSKASALPQPDKAPPSPEQPQAKPAASPEHKAPPPSPPAAAAPEASKGTSGGAKEPPPPSEKTEAAGEKQSMPWSDIAASLGMADYGRQTALSDALLGEVRAQAKKCWTVPTGWSDPGQVSVTVRFELKPDGTIDGEPAVVEFPATPIGAAAAKAAIDAVQQCGPFRLPAAQYDQWKDIQLSLAP